MLNKILLITGLVLSTGCDKVPPAPEMWQCGYTWKFQKFVCINTVTKEKVNRPLNDPIMEGSQALSLDDYKKSELWVDNIITLAKTRCK